MTGHDRRECIVMSDINFRNGNNLCQFWCWRAGTRMSLGHHPSIHAAASPDLAACIDSTTGEVLTYAELEGRSNQTAHMFRDWGFLTGDAIVIQCENHARFLELVWGAHRAGLYYTPISWHLTPPEIAYIVQNSGARAMFVSTRFSEAALTVAATVDPSVKRISIFGAIEGFESYEELRAHFPETRIDDEASGSDMLYTSGTTGQPKGVKFPLSGQPVDYADPFELMFRAEGYDAGSVCATLGPMYHPSSLYTAMCTHRFGGTWIIIDKFDAENTLRIIARFRVSMLSCVPTHFVRLLKLPKTVRDSYDVSSLHCVLHTAAPCPVDVKYAMIEWFGPIVLEFYGGTEKVGGTIIRASEWLEHPGSIGKPVAGSVHVVNEESWEDVPTGQTGSIYFDIGVAFDYHGDPEKTKAIYSPQGWRTLGDIGHVDDDGYIYLTDRKSNMIITGGVNVYPQEAENRLIAHPKVGDVAVFGVPNADFGEEVKAVVQPLDWADAGAELETELLAWCREALSRIKCPRSIDFDQHLPREANGKLYKRLLVDRYRQKLEV